MNEPSSRIEFQTASEDETKAIGRRLGELLSPGALVALDGELGSGKTRFVQGMAQGLGISPDEVSSPTFVLCHIYHGRLTLLHVDAYRLKSSNEIADLGISEALEEGSIVVIEWANKIAAALPNEFIHVQIDEIEPTTRRIELKAHGKPSQAVLEEW